MRKATRNKLALAGSAIVVASLAAACGSYAGSEPDPSKTPPPACHTVKAMAHVNGTKRWYLTLKGESQPVLVSQKTFKAYTIGDHYPRSCK